MRVTLTRGSQQHGWRHELEALSDDSDLDEEPDCGDRLMKHAMGFLMEAFQNLKAQDAMAFMDVGEGMALRSLRWKGGLPYPRDICKSNRDCGQNSRHPSSQRPGLRECPQGWNWTGSPGGVNSTTPRHQVQWRPPNSWDSFCPHPHLSAGIWARSPHPRGQSQGRYLGSEGSCGLLDGDPTQCKCLGIPKLQPFHYGPETEV